MQTDSTFRPALKLMMGRAAAFAVTFFIPIVLSRIFDQREFGTYKQVFLIVTSLYVVAQIGMSESLYYFIPRFPNAAGRLVVNSIVTVTLMGSVCLVCLILGRSHVAEWLSNPSLSAYTLVAGAYLVLMMSCSAFENVMVARRQFGWATLSYAASDVLRGTLLVLFAIVTRDLWWVLMAGLLFLSIRLMTFLWYLRIEFGSQLGFDFRLLKRQFIYTIPYSFAVLIEVVQQNYHQYAVSWYFDAATFAIYAVGCLQIPLADFLASPVSNVMMVRMGEELREGRKAHILPIWHDTNRKLALVFMPMAAMLIVNAHSVITFLFTNRYAASVPIFMWWSLTVLSSVFQTDGVLRVFAQTRFLVVMNVARLVTIIGLMGWSLRNFNLLGPVLVTLAGMVVAKSVALGRIKYLLDVPLQRLMPWRELGTVAFVAMAAALPCALVNFYVNASPAYLLPITGMVYLSVYSVLLLVCGLLSENEKRAVIDVFARFRRRLYADT